MRRQALLSFTIVAATAMSIAAQDEGALRRAFEGTSVTLKIDMPATSQGVDVRPGAGTPVDFRTVGNLLKADGVGVHRGETITVTKVVVKDHHIEFQLGGGGFGTFSDILSTSAAPAVPYESKSRRQKDLEEELKYTYEPAARKSIKDEIDRESRNRARDNTVAAVVNAQSQTASQAAAAAKRAQGGSRFNIKYDGPFPEGALTPQGVMNALRQYVDFGADRASDGAAPAATASATAPGNSGLRKGLTVVQVEQMLGPAAKAADRTEGSLEMNVREYDTATEHVSCQFVGGVLVNYVVTPRGR